MSEEFKPGVYRHYKGGIYRALHMARFSENRDQLCVVYVSCTTDPKSQYKNEIWVRPFSDPPDCAWTGKVQWPDGITRPRFVPIEVAPSEHFICNNCNGYFGREETSGGAYVCVKCKSLSLRRASLWE